jgi:ABC-type oligopeptide transport system substrate-binding subunit
MAVQAGDERGDRLADLVRAELAPIGIDVQPRIVPDLAAALRDPDEDLHLAVLTTSLDYPDPASFLARMLGHDVPDRWLSTSTHAAVDRLDGLTGAARDRAAAALAARIAISDVPVVAFGTRELGVVLGPRLGCRVWNGVDAGLDLAALCLAGS